MHDTIAMASMMGHAYDSVYKIMAKENLQHIRQLVAQQAARMMAEDGISDYAYAKKKAGRQLGALESSSLPSNAEVEEELKLYNALYLSE